MNGWLLDTNVVSELGRATPARNVVAWARAVPEGRLFISVLTLAEYEKGIAHLDPASPAVLRYEAALAALAARFRGRVLPVSDAIVHRWGHISGAVKRLTRQSPPVIDTLLAATAIEHQLVLVTRNIRGVEHAGATLLDPWEAAAQHQVR
ncbi:MAG: type II toxin-antitoxin system VapC family toxin [Alphaproteobacteria bacterium]